MNIEKLEEIMNELGMKCHPGMVYFIHYPGNSRKKGIACSKSQLNQAIYLNENSGIGRDFVYSSTN